MSSVQPPVDRFEQCTRVRAVFDLLGSGCVAFYPRLADLTGSVTAALLLGQCLYWTDRVLRQQPEREGWFWKTAVEWRQEIGLTRREQETARCRLRVLGLLEEKRAGMPAKRWFRIDVAALEQQLGPAPAAIDCGPHWIGADSALARRLGPPLVYWRRLREASGSVTAALYLSRALFWQRLALQQWKPQPEWFHRPIFQSQQILRFGRRQQEHARARLRQQGFLEERLVPGVRRRLMTRLDLQALARALAGAGRAATRSGAAPGQGKRPRAARVAPPQCHWAPRRPRKIRQTATAQSANHGWRYRALHIRRRLRQRTTPYPRGPRTGPPLQGQVPCGPQQQRRWGNGNFQTSSCPPSGHGWRRSSGNARRRRKRSSMNLRARRTTRRAARRSAIRWPMRGP
ncbi:MAG: hypothetical protein IPN24_13965 [Betaproteobacteria bacterium]|nr:hypothetical protein [Betaproteobacteria bacterium]